jgi:hypothetical protein
MPINPNTAKKLNRLAALTAVQCAIATRRYARMPPSASVTIAGNKRNGIAFTSKPISKARPESAMKFAKNTFLIGIGRTARFAKSLLSGKRESQRRTISKPVIVIDRTIKKYSSAAELR